MPNAKVSCDQEIHDMNATLVAKLGRILLDLKMYK